MVMGAAGEGGGVWPNEALIGRHGGIGGRSGRHAAAADRLRVRPHHFHMVAVLVGRGKVVPAQSRSRQGTRGRMSGQRRERLCLQRQPMVGTRALVQ